MTSLVCDARLAFGGFALDASIDTPLIGTTALFGPSGGGKSTLLRIIAGLEARAKGRVSFGGKVWADSSRDIWISPHQRPVGFVFQDGRLFAHLDVIGNLRYADRRAEDGSITCDAVIDALALEPLLQRRPDTLSGGERQRVALGRTLLTRPRLLLLDEPLSALDMARKADILPYLRDVPNAFGIPSLYVSHAIEEVVQLADTMIVLVDGKVQAIGPTADILERIDLQAITGRFEAGAMLQATVTGQDDAYKLTRLELEGQALTMPMLTALRPGDAVRLRVRARDVTLALTRPTAISSRNLLAGTVDAIAAEAETAFAEVTVAVGEQRLRARVTREAVDTLGLTPGIAIHALIKSASFDRRGLIRA